MTESFSTMYTNGASDSALHTFVNPLRNDREQTVNRLISPLETY